MNGYHVDLILRDIKRVEQIIKDTAVSYTHLDVYKRQTQPLFNRGVNIANLKIAKSRQEEAKLLFRQSLLNAGKEVNDALTYREGSPDCPWPRRVAGP